MSFCPLPPPDLLGLDFKKKKCECSTSLTGHCSVHGPIDFSETTYHSGYGWRDEHGAKVSPPPPARCRYCLAGACAYHG